MESLEYINFETKFNGPPKTVSYKSSSVAPRSKSTVTSLNTRMSLRPSTKTPALLKTARSTTVPVNNPIVNKHTLEIQFFNKNKNYLQMRNELIEKQTRVLNSYLKLKSIKKQLEKFGKTVDLEEIKLVNYQNYVKFQIEESHLELPQEILMEIKHSSEKISISLVNTCKNLLSRWATIGDLLEDVSKSNVYPLEVATRIEAFKNEGVALQQSLEMAIEEHNIQIENLLSKWRELLNGHCFLKEGSILESSLNEQQKLTQDTKFELNSNNDSITELKNTIQILNDEITKLRQNLDEEKNINAKMKSQININENISKPNKYKLKEIENVEKYTETENVNLKQEVKTFEDEQERKEVQWNKEKKELIIQLKEQDQLLEQLKTEKSQFQMRLIDMENRNNSIRNELENTINSLRSQLRGTKYQLHEVITQKDDLLRKYVNVFENYINKIGLRCNEKINDSISNPDLVKIQEKNQNVTKKNVKKRDAEDKVCKLEIEQVNQIEKNQMLEEIKSCEITKLEKRLIEQECIIRYQKLLKESENKLTEKTSEVVCLHREILQLKVRQETLKKQNHKYPLKELEKIALQGRYTLEELKRRSIKSDQKLEHSSNIDEKQIQQMSLMENLLRYRENMAEVLRASREGLVLEKENLVKYSQEINSLLTETMNQAKVKERVIKELQEKVNLRQREIKKLETEVRQLEINLLITSDKRFKMQSQQHTQGDEQ